MGKNNSIRRAPETIPGILKELGPGLIIAGSIVGSGELIATTLTGAEAGFWLMWLIVIGCVIKVFAQLELGRYSISTGQTSLEGLSKLPGMKPAGAHWIVWLWLIMFITSLGQAGGIVGAVGQSINIGVPLTEEGKVFNKAADAKVQRQIAHVTGNEISNNEAVSSDASKNEAQSPSAELPPTGPDVYYWAFILAIITSILLYRGRYGLIEKIALALVASFTALSLVNLFLLQLNEVWAVSFADITQGLSFRLPPPKPGVFPIATALATFGIIGMGAGELIFYPYWCLEKGYGKYIGPRENSSEWTHRAKGWIRVMHWDAWCSMMVYTLATIIFYLLGAAVLSRAELRPKEMDLIRTLSAIYEPVFGYMAVGLFLFGSLAVLYSTFFVGTASNALVFADALGILSRQGKHQLDRRKIRPYLGLVLPLIAFVMFVFFPKPKFLILLAGVTQTFMLPVLAFSALYFRYNYKIEALRPGKLWDVFLWVSAFALLLVGIWLGLRLIGLL